MAEIGVKIKELREIRGMKQSHLADLIGVKSGGVISNWEKGLNKPDIEKLVSLCQILDTTFSFLLDYNDSKSKVTLDISEENIINKYRKIDSHGKNTIKTVLDLEFSRCSQERPVENVIPYKKRQNEQRELVQIKIYSQKASAGFGNHLLEDSAFDLQSFDYAAVPYSTDYGIRIKGDSMEPQIFDGDIVWIKEQANVKPGEIGVFVLNGEAFCKEVNYDKSRNLLSLLSLNENYSPILVREFDDLQVVGKVLGNFSS